MAIPHDFVSVAGPEQGAPQALPLMHGRDLVIVPIPQLTEQALHAP